MRLARTALTLSLLLLGTNALQAQIAHNAAGSYCGCEQCQSCQQCGDAACCQALLPSIAQGLQSALGGFIPGHIGCDARHKIYRAALQRSTFDKKCLLPVAYYSHILPLWSHNRCCCGPVHSQCPTCGPDGMPGEEIFEMQEYPAGTPMEPTPAVESEAPPMPETTIVPPQARGVPSQGRSAKRARPVSTQRPAQKSATDQVARQDDSATPSQALRWLAPSAPQSQPRLRQVSAVAVPSRPDPVNPLR